MATGGFVIVLDWRDIQSQAMGVEHAKQMGGLPWRDTVVERS